MPLFHLMAGGENICEISALIGELKSQREERRIIHRKSYGMIYDYLFDGFIPDLFLASFLQFPYSDAGSKLFSFDLKKTVVTYKKSCVPELYPCSISN